MHHRFRQASAGRALVGALASASAALSCSSFQTLTPGLDASSDSSTHADVGGKGHDGGTQTHDAHAGGMDASDSGQEASMDAAPAVDTQCAFPWANVSGCAGRTSSVIGSIQDSDDPRIAIAQSGSGRIAVCYASISSDFLTRSILAVTFMPTNLGQAQTTTLFTGTTDTTGACALAGGAGDTFHVVVYDTENDVLDYGDLVLHGGTPVYGTFGSSPMDGYVTLGLLTLDPAHVMAVVGNATTGLIQSFAGTTFDGGATFGAPVTAESAIGLNVVGAGQFSVKLSHGTPTMLVDMEPGDAATTSRADLAAFGGSTWGVQTVEGASLTSVVGYSPSVAVSDGGVHAVYFERGLGAPDAATSQIHVVDVVGGSIGSVQTPIAAYADNDPENPLVGAASAVGPDGRLHIAYIASPLAGNVSIFEARPQSTVAGSPILTDTVDDTLGPADPPSVNMLIEPSGRIDIVYMRMSAHAVYFATREP